MPQIIFTDMSDFLRITNVQCNITWEDINANLTHFDGLLENLRDKADLIILPEMFTTGFSMNTAVLAETMNGPTMQWLREQAARTKAMIIGSFIVKEDSVCRNRLVAMQPSGEFVFYDKKHLFALGGEHQFYLPAKQQLQFSWKGWEIRPLICYDLRFPEWSRNKTGYDLLVYIASWPDKRSMHWRQLLVARAIENQSYVSGINRIGMDGNGLNHQGDSMVIDFSGQILYCAANIENISTITLSKSALLDYRKSLPFLKDQDFESAKS
jgi:omega-amidase